MIYRTTHERSRDCKFTKSSRFLQKEAVATQSVSMRPTSHAYSAGSFLRYAGFYAGPTVDTLEEANLIRERGL